MYFTAKKMSQPWCDIPVQGKPGLKSKFQAWYDYIIEPCLKKKKRKKEKLRLRILNDLSKVTYLGGSYFRLAGSNALL